ncbi:MAG: 2-amino-4-hydroxy-6-hydroxymethyldihydropteridine diphosphokinase [Armatimonadota bacterium]|nr:2-amino-4-hydroxy-6-hydroxymethyldihydropteridine diphosphokinase [Armatimonadota bacterium]
MRPARTHRAVVLLGSNVDRERALPQAVALLAARARLRALSSVYETEPVGRPDQPPFFNAAAVVETDLDPAAFRREVLAPIEAQLGRRRTADKWAPRTIDLDLILWDDEVCEVEGRPVPHPELLTRAHVAVPVAEVLPDARHPVTGERLAALAGRLAALTRIVRRADVRLESAAGRAQA